MANGDSERKVSRGQKWRDAFTAQWFNDVTEATRQYKRNRGNVGGSNGSSLIESNIQVLIQNGTDESLDEPYRIVRIDEALLDVTADPIGANTRPAFMGLVPDDANNPIAILQDGAKNQEFYSGSGSNPLVDLVPAVVSGVTICKVLMNDPDDMWANPVNGVTEYLESSENGQARILGYWEIDEESASTNIYWAFVNLIGYSNTVDIVDVSHPDATPAVRGYVNFSSTEQVFGGPKKFNDKLRAATSFWISNSGYSGIDGPLEGNNLPFYVGQFGYLGGPLAPLFGAGFKDPSGGSPFFHIGRYVIGYDDNDDPEENGTLDGSGDAQIIPIKATPDGSLVNDTPFIPLSKIVDPGSLYMQPESFMISNGIVSFMQFLTARNYGYTNNGAIPGLHSGYPPFVTCYSEGEPAGDGYPKRCNHVMELEGSGTVSWKPNGTDDTSEGILALNITSTAGGSSIKLFYGGIDSTAGIIVDDGIAPKRLAFVSELDNVDGGSF